MSGYAASARLQGGSTRFVAVAADRRPITHEPVAPSPEGADRGRAEPARRPAIERLASRWDDLREAWAQTTFYLFDPESWR